MFRRAFPIGVLLLLVGATALVGSPVQLSYVYSDSMEPTIGVDDGYLLVPAGEVQPGDVVTFWSDEKGAFVTHRVVGRTDGGFVTKGDNNPTTDQAAGLPPVTRDRIHGEVFAVGGDPFVVPNLGVVVGALRANLATLLALGLAAVLLVSLGGGTGGPRRDVPRVRDLVRPVFLVALLTTVCVLAYGGATYDLSVVAVGPAATPDGQSTMLVGTTLDVQAVVTSPATPFTTRVAGGDGVDLTRVAYTPENVTVDATVLPPATIGPVPARLTVNQYPAVLPRSALEWLHGIHPLAAASTTTALVFGPLWLGYVVLVDGATPIRRSRSRLWTFLTEGFP